MVVSTVEFVSLSTSFDYLAQEAPAQRLRPMQKNKGGQCVDNLDIHAAYAVLLISY